MDLLIFKKKEVKKADAKKHFKKLPVPNIKTNLKSKTHNNKIKKTNKKKYLDAILTDKFLDNYFKKKELKIKNLN